MLFIFSVLILIGAIIALSATKDKKSKLVTGVIIAIFVLISFSQLIRVVPAGHVGVVDIFGKVNDRTLKAGINLVNPFAKVLMFSIKTQEMKENMTVPSEEGLNVGLEISALYHLEPEEAADVYKTVGYNYQDVILVPQFRSVVRGVTASYAAKALYTSAREELSQQIKEQLDNQVSKRGIFIESTPLRSIALPERLRKAIEEKLQADQESQRMQFILEKEKQEAERKRIEAQGIADFQRIVSKGIDQQLLKWKGIEATEKLANSQNAKIVIVGGKDGLPLILGSQ
ncbi:prohibitin family protein [bacterium]|nr:prohibitin family protein [bacterium]